MTKSPHDEQHRLTLDREQTELHFSHLHSSSRGMQSLLFHFPSIFSLARGVVSGITIVVVVLAVFLGRQE